MFLKTLNSEFNAVFCTYSKYAWWSIRFWDSHLKSVSFCVIFVRITTKMALISLKIMATWFIGYNNIIYVFAGFLHLLVIKLKLTVIKYSVFIFFCAIQWVFIIKNQLLNSKTFTCIKYWFCFINFIFSII